MVIKNGKLIAINKHDIIDGVFRNNDAIQVGEHCFYDIPTLKVIILPNVTSVDNYNFSFCENLKQISLPKVTDIDKLCIHYCYNLKSISIPNVINIGSDCFWGCPELTNVILPQIISIGERCFYDCMTLTTLVLPNETIPLIEGEYFPFVIKQERLTEQFLILKGGNLLSYQDDLIIDTKKPFMLIQDGKRVKGSSIKNIINSNLKINGQIQFHPRL